MTSSRAIILLSGGLDSATLLALARSRSLSCLTLAFDYGQRHRHELYAAASIANALGALEHRQIVLDPRAFAGSALTTAIAPGPAAPSASGPPSRATPSSTAATPPTLAVPKGRSEVEMSQTIPVTYVPARNLVFLAIAVATAESVGASQIHIGVNAVDYSGYPDCRPAFIDAMQRTARLGTKSGVEQTNPITIHAPLIDMTKADIIRLGTSLGLDYSRTHSCYDPTGPVDRPIACGQCDACTLRRRGFEAANVPDPTRYAPQVAR